MTDKKVIIIKGAVGEGKTTKLQHLSNLLLKKDILVSGFLASASFIGGERNTYKLQKIGSDESTILCSTIPHDGYEKIGKYYFNNKSIGYGEQIISENISNNVIVIDEIGRFELDGKVWHNSLASLLQKKNIVIMISVRDSLVENILHKFSVTNYSIYSTKHKNEDIINEVMHFLGNDICDTS